MNQDHRIMNRRLDWLGLAIEPLPSPVTQLTNPDDNQNYPRGCNFTRKLCATDNNPSGTFTHLYHSNKQETSVYLLNTLIDMTINLSEKFKSEFSNTRFTQKIGQIKELIRAVEHLITQDNQINDLREQLVQLQNNNIELNKKLDQVTQKLTKLPTRQDIMELTQLPKRVEEQTLQSITQISIDADNRLEQIKKLIEQFHSEWLG